MLHFLVVARSHFVLFARALAQPLVHLHLCVFERSRLHLLLALLLATGLLRLLLCIALGCYRSKLLEINLLVGVEDPRGCRLDLLLARGFGLVLRLDSLHVLHLRVRGLAVRG